MSIYLRLLIIITLGFLCAITAQVIADLPAPPSSQQQPFFQHKTETKTPLPPTTPPQFPPLHKKVLPIMTKPFGMPGVIGFQNEQWQGTDYLGHLSNNIGVSVEILKGENIPSTPDASILEARVRDIFTKDLLIPHADVKEGPPLPFLHILLIIYPVDKDRFAIFGASRLFEQIEVMRKNFMPAGYWQGITWENQDVILASNNQLDEQMKNMVDKLTTAFATRYTMYNPPPGSENEKK